MKKLLLTALAVGLCAALAMASLASARGAAATKVTLRGQNGDFHGKVLSDRHKCLGGRKVILYRQTGNDKDPSTDVKIASDTSERHKDHGDWSVGNTGQKSGKFYAHVKSSPGCHADNSRTKTL